MAGLFSLGIGSRSVELSDSLGQLKGKLGLGGLRFFILRILLNFKDTLRGIQSEDERGLLRIHFKGLSCRTLWA